METKVGARLGSTVCDTEIMVIKWPGGDVDLTCGGSSMAPAGEGAAGAEVNPDFAEGTQLGKRYVDEDGAVELLCVKPGEGSLAIGSESLTIKGAKPLPSSD